MPHDVEVLDWRLEEKRGYEIVGLCDRVKHVGEQNAPKHKGGKEGGWGGGNWINVL